MLFTQLLHMQQLHNNVDVPSIFFKKRKLNKNESVGSISIIVQLTYLLL
jgi:hypothetical protein